MVRTVFRRVNSRKKCKPPPNGMVCRLRAEGVVPKNSSRRSRLKNNNINIYKPMSYMAINIYMYEIHPRVIKSLKRFKKKA